MKFGVNRNFNKEPILIAKDIDCLTKKQLIGVISRSSHGFSFPRIMSLNLFILGILILSNCQSEQVQISNRDDLFKNCMETFEDEAKCSSFLKKSEQDLLTEEEILRKQRAELTKEQLGGLKIRSELKGAVQSKSKTFVLKYLGEPDSIFNGGDQREYLIYTRPIAKYAPESDPDDEITVIMRRGKVERVNHKPPPGADTSFSIKNLMRNKEERIASEKEKSLQK
jgi:hypothetical protein